MKERPILFSGAMVRAILAGRKTQTRRIVKPQPETEHDGEPYWFVGGYRAWQYRETKDILRRGGNVLKCPYGQPGNRLWVREKHALENRYRNVWCRYEADGERCVVPAPTFVNVARPGWRPSIHMHRWASRITLEITGVRVERLKDISHEDAISEGVEFAGCADLRKERLTIPQHIFANLWESLNGEGSWELNPWVWVIEFKRVDHFADASKMVAA